VEDNEGEWEVTLKHTANSLAYNDVLQQNWLLFPPCPQKESIFYYAFKLTQSSSDVHFPVSFRQIRAKSYCVIGFLQFRKKQNEARTE